MKRQSGITLVGFIFLLIVGAFFAYTAMKLVPAYMDYFNVAKALNTVASQSRASGLTPQMLHDQLDKQQLSQYFADEDIAENNLSIVNNPKGGSDLKLAYDKQIPWIYNIDFLIHFEKSVPVQGQAAQAQ